MCLRRYHNAIIMKKLFLGFSVLLVISYFLTGSVNTFAKDTATILSVTPSVAPDKSNNNETQPATPAAKVEYVLPYPGILPDNPLYFLKATRDKIISFLISDVIKKAEFNLLTSDKRINAAWSLSTRGKYELAVSTLSKSNNYLDQAITATAASRNAGKNVDTVLHNLKNAIKKHQEVTVAIKSKIDKKLSPQLQNEIQRLENFGRTVDQLLPQK